MLKTLTLFAALCAASVAWCAKPNVIPALREWSDGAAGETYALTAASRVVIAPDACPKLEQYAKTFAQDLGRTLVKGQPAPGDILLQVKPDAAANPEGYTLAICKHGIQV